MRAFLITGIALLACAFLSAPARAATETEDKIASCAGIINRINRLVCYDELATSLGFVPPDQVNREAQILETYGFWEVTKRRNAAGENIIYLKNDSVEDVTSRTGIHRTPTLVVKCKSGQTDVYLDWKTRLIPRHSSWASSMSLQMQLDAEPKQTVNWELSTDRHALFVPDPVEFIKSMRQHERLVLHISPPHDSAQTIVHDISGLNMVLELLVQNCYK